MQETRAEWIYRIIVQNSVYFPFSIDRPQGAQDPPITDKFEPFPANRGGRNERTATGVFVGRTRIDTSSIVVHAGVTSLSRGYAQNMDPGPEITEANAIRSNPRR